MHTKELTFRLVKIADIGYITVLYFIAGIFLAKQCDALFDKLFGEHSDAVESQKSGIRQTVELIIMFWIIGIITYIVRNTIELIPSPFEGIAGFKHLLVGDLRQAPIFTFIFLLFQDHLINKIKYYYNRLFGK